MKKIFLIVLLIIGLGSLPAGQAGLSAQSFRGKIYSGQYESSKQAGASDTLKILAVMVEFQKDDDQTTFGNGKFGSIYSKDYGDTILDPLPHDANYFSNHLEFAKNYFKKVSGGRLNIAYKVLPQIITVSQTMRNYSPPPRSSSDFTELGKFAQEVWQIAGTTFANVDFSKYDVFTIFHAGVGREFTAPGSLGNERDLPSVYLGIKSLKKIFGNDFNGFTANGGKSLINNTMILPSTESREVQSIGGKTLVQLTTNGLIVSSIANHIGLPDLFNTETGKSAIGRFGLMDGESIFAYSGLFPPEPSPWEKIYLGWAQSVTLSVGDKKVNLAARLAAAANDTTILKIPISSSEYFLVENRARDANKNGINLTYKIRGGSFTFKLDKDKGRFQWYGVDTLRGVITDVDEFDWAAPGSGIVIWHIDEKIINEKIAENKINADFKRRGVYVEEADGIQDIGTEYYNVLYQSYLPRSAGEEDLWYAGNKAKYYKNKFGPDTKPNTNSNNGANSLVTMENFSAAANKMSFNISFGKGNIKLISSTRLNLGQSKKIFASNGYTYNNSLFVIENSTLYKYDINGSLIKTIPDFTEVQPVAFDYNGTEYLIGSKGQLLNIYSYFSGKESFKGVDVLSKIATIAVDKISSSIPKILIGTNNGFGFAVRTDALLSINQFVPADYTFYKGNDAVINFGVGDNYYTILQPKNFIVHTARDIVLSLNLDSKKTVLTKDLNGRYVSIILLNENNFLVVTEGTIISSFQIKSKNTINSFAVADIYGNGQNYILVSNGSSIEAYNFNGIVANNLPFEEPNGENFIGTPLAVDLDGDGFAEVIAFTDQGKVYAINATTGKAVDGFPLSSGAQSAATPVLFGEELPTAGPIPTYKPYLAVLDQTNQLYLWNLAPTQGKSYWNGEFGDAMNTSFVIGPSTSQQTTEFFPTDKVYNWPNPVYGDETKIRYYVSENSSVKIKIFDLAGELAAEFENRADGGFDNETTWNVSKVQSGVYYAQVEVKGDSGNTASKVIKIAVIK